MAGRTPSLPQACCQDKKRSTGEGPASWPATSHASLDAAGAEEPIDTRPEHGPHDHSGLEGSVTTRFGEPSAEGYTAEGTQRLPVHTAPSVEAAPRSLDFAIAGSCLRSLPQ